MVLIASFIHKEPSVVDVVAQAMVQDPTQVVQVEVVVQVLPLAQEQVVHLDKVIEVVMVLLTPAELQVGVVVELGVQVVMRLMA
jgi:hypothetical protein